MGSYIDNKIHFVWVGGIIPENCVKEIFRCLNVNCEAYDIFLWTDRPQENGSAMQVLIEKYYGGERGLKSNVQPAESGRLVLNINYDVQKLKIFTKNKEQKIKIIDVEELASVVGVLMHKYHDALSPEIRNYGRASDILRLGILSEMGGIYMDTDVESIAPLPKKIYADDDFLMGYGQAGRASFTNAVMAAPANSDFITQLMASILRMYTFWEKRNWWHENDEQVRRTRIKLAYFKKRQEENPSDENRRRISDMRQKYQKAMEDGTLPITGPTRVELFLYKRLLKDKAKDPINFFKEMMAGKSQTPSSFNEVMGQLKINVKEEMIAHGVYKIYKFPMEYINIRSDASWM